jgi:uncharacterized membrane protein HdeD (DUF308 family)
MMTTRTGPATLATIGHEPWTAMMEVTVAKESRVATRESPLHWWVPATLGVTAIAFGIALPILPDVSLRVMATLVGVGFVLGGIARLRTLVAGWAVLATVLAVLWLFCGLAVLVLATTTGGSIDGRLIGLGAFSTIVGIAFAVWPRR